MITLLLSVRGGTSYTIILDGKLGEISLKLQFLVPISQSLLAL